MARYAVVLVGAHQYQVQENDVFEVEKLGSKAESDAKEIKLDQVLLVRENGKVKIGQPFDDGPSCAYIPYAF